MIREKQSSEAWAPSRNINTHIPNIVNRLFLMVNQKYHWRLGGIQVILEQFADPQGYRVSSYLIRTTMTESLSDRIIRIKIIITEEKRPTPFLPFPPSNTFPASTRWVTLLPGRRDGIIASQKPTSKTVGFLIFSALMRSSIPLVLKTKERTRRFLDHDTSSILYFCGSTELLRIRYSSLKKEKPFSSKKFWKREPNNIYLPCSNAPL